MKFLHISCYTAFVDRHFTIIVPSYEMLQFAYSVVLSSLQCFSMHDRTTEFTPLLVSSKLATQTMAVQRWAVLE